MKLSNAALFLAAATPAFAATTKVSIDVKCKGTNINKLSVSETTIVANAIESSYNDVHGAADQDDNELVDVHYGLWSADEAKYLQQGGGYGGGFNCNLCSKNDDALLDVSSSSGAHKAWETKFVETLLESSSATLAQASSCSLKMKPIASAYEEAVELKDSFSDTRVIIEPRCSGINFGSLSVSSNALAGHILEESFNKVHSGTDDVELVDVSWGAFGDIGNGDLQGRRGSYGGGINCNLCSTNDDAVLGVGGQAIKAWQAEFVAGLEASGVKEFDKVKQCTITMGPSPYYEQEPNVDIDVKCKGGPNMNSLSVIQATLVAHSLQESYNTVHGEAAADDSELTDVFFQAPAFADGELQQRRGSYGGGFNCNLCSTNDDFMTVDATGRSHAAWESEFVSILRSSSSPGFQSIKSCDITMKPHSATLVGADELVSATTPVNIDVKCKGLNFGKLSVADDTFAANVLQATYNSVHGAIDNDDTELTDVHYGSAFVSATEALQGRRGSFGGGINCNLCSTNDDSMLEVSGKSAKQWEDAFTLGLLEDGRRSFQKVTECSIKMSAKGFSVVEEPVKCGLRACADE